jgi:hypothetical protein
MERKETLRRMARVRRLLIESREREVKEISLVNINISFKIEVALHFLVITFSLLGVGLRILGGAHWRIRSGRAREKCKSFINLAQGPKMKMIITRSSWLSFDSPDHIALRNNGEFVFPSPEMNEFSSSLRFHIKFGHRVLSSTRHPKGLVVGFVVVYELLVYYCF